MAAVITRAQEAVHQQDLQAAMRLLQACEQTRHDEGGVFVDCEGTPHTTDLVPYGNVWVQNGPCTGSHPCGRLQSQSRRASDASVTQANVHL